MTNDEIEKSFMAFPTVVSYPVFPCGESWVGFGHISQKVFTKCCALIHEHLTEDTDYAYKLKRMYNNVDHTYAYMVDDTEFFFCEEDHPNAFPVTALHT